MEIQILESVVLVKLRTHAVPSVRIAGSDKLQPFKTLSNRPTIDSSVHHNFLNHGQ